MRRLVIIGALLGLAMFPAPASAATPADPTIAVSSLHYAGRGVIELDLGYMCAKPTMRTSYWEASIYVELYQGHGRTSRYGAYYAESDGLTCDGQLHTQAVRVTSDDGPRFRGGGVSIWAEIYTCYDIARTGEWVEQSGELGGRFRVRHSG
jgi:hypothetical protein